MPTTVSDLIHSSMRLIGAIAAGETLETAELNDSFDSLNQMTASWNTEGLSLAGRRRSFVGITSVNRYTLAQRAVHIEAASAQMVGIDCPLELIDAAGWESITEKEATAIQIKKLFCDYGYPLSTIYIWPTPRVTGGIEIFDFAPIDPFATVGQNIDLPPGYEIALRFNLAVLLLPEYPRSEVDPTLLQQATNYKASIVQLNASNHAITPQPVAAQSVAAQAKTP